MFDTAAEWWAFAALVLAGFLVPVAISEWFIRGARGKR
jgi:hypothetical protein